VSTLRSLMRGLQALDLVRASAEPVRTIDLAERLKMDKGSASRTLRALEAAGYVERTAQRRYAPGKKLRPGPPPQGIDVVRLRERAQPLLEELVAFGRECAHLAVLAGDRVLYLDRVESGQSLRVDHPVGMLAPLHCTALGKAFLAFAGVPIPARLERHTPRTVVDPQLLAAHLKSVAPQGYTVDDEEFALGVRCVAAPLRGEAGQVVGAIGLSGPVSRISLERLAELGAKVREVAASYGRKQGRIRSAAGKSRRSQGAR
jgi:IclR family transcriptional regulator, acetate operon repressor